MPTPSESFTEAIIELFVPCNDVPENSGEPFRSSAAGGPSVLHGQPPTSSLAGPCGASAVAAIPQTVPQSPSYPDGCTIRPGTYAQLTESASTVASRGAANPDALTEGSDASGSVPSLGNESWVCRAYCFGERDAHHSNGAISVLQSLANKSKFINNITNGKAVARVIPSYSEVRDRFGLSHIELSFEGQQISRADMFLVAEALRDNILYEGEEVRFLGFSLKVNEMLRRGAKESTSHNDVDGREPMRSGAPNVGPVLGGAQHFGSSQPQQKVEEETNSYRAVRCGLVTKGTVVNFLSLSPVHYVILEISAQMWNLMSDGCFFLDCAVKNFLGEYLTQQLPKHKASPHLRVVMAGRLHSRYAVKGRVDVVHVMQIPHDYRPTLITEEISLQCGEFLRRVLNEVKENFQTSGVASVSCSANVDNAHCRYSSSTKAIDSLAVGELFVHAKHSCTIETIGLLLDESEELRSYRNTGLMISVVSAGQGVFRVTNDLLQAISLRLLKVGMEKVNIICMGRPPLHFVPLLECITNDDDPHYSQFIAEQPSHRVYVKPEWARCYFYHLPSDIASNSTLSRELFTREEWLQKHWKQCEDRRCAGEVEPLSLGLALPLPQPREPLLLPAIRLHASAPLESVSEANFCCEEPRSAKSSVLSYSTLRSSGAEQRLMMQSVRRSPEAFIFSSKLRSVPVDLLDEGGDVPGALFRSLRNSCATRSEGDAGRKLRWLRVESRLQPAPQPFVYAKWYRLEGICSDRGARGGIDWLCGLIVKEKRDRCQNSCVGSPLDTRGVVSFGKSILDCDVQSGRMVLRLDVNATALPGRFWSPQVITDIGRWTTLMRSFSDKIDHFTSEERKYIDPKFCASEIFVRELSTIVADGGTLLLATRTNNVTFITDERVVLTYQGDFFSLRATSADDADTVSLSLSVESTDSFGARCNDPTSEKGCAMTAAIAHIQLKNCVMFAINPVNPYCTPVRADETSLSSHSATAETILRRRWKLAHPEQSASHPGDGGAACAQRSHWSVLCHCRILPLFGMKPAYPRDSFFDKPTHQYSIALGDTMQSLEYILQRLHHRHQIVLLRPSVADIEWPREAVAPHARVVMSIGYQIHELKIDETGQNIHITRLMHRGVYTSLRKMQKVEHNFLLLNYLGNGFSARRANLELQIGEEIAFQWDTLDSYVHDRHKPGTLIPRSLTLALRESELCMAILPESVENPCSTYRDFVKFMESSLNLQLRTSTPATWEENIEELSMSVPDGDYLTDEQKQNYVVLVDENHLSLGYCRTMDHKTGWTRCLEGLPPNRHISINVTLPKAYNRSCHYLLRVSWIVCMQPILLKWIGAVIANAAVHHLRCFLMPAYEYGTKQDELILRYTVRAREGEDGSHLREQLLKALTSCTWRYFPDCPMMGGSCRLLHASGLCYVISSPNSDVVAQWYENPMMRTGQLEHKQLLDEFLSAVRVVREALRQASCA